MSTHEERIAALEETISDQQSVLQGFTYELTKIKAFIVTQTEITLRLKQDTKELSQDMEASFKQLSTYLGTIETRLDRQDAHFDRLETDITSIKTRLDRQDAHLDRQDARFDRIETLLIQVVERLPKAS
jgi:uncharacterized coiled-coil protein SlyX